MKNIDMFVGGRFRIGEIMLVRGCLDEKSIDYRSQ